MGFSFFRNFAYQAVALIVGALVEEELSIMDKSVSGLRVSRFVFSSGTCQ
jgi:hypothetical protein